MDVVAVVVAITVILLLSADEQQHQVVVAILDTERGPHQGIDGIIWQNIGEECRKQRNRKNGYAND